MNHLVMVRSNKFKFPKLTIFLKIGFCLTFLALTSAEPEASFGGHNVFYPRTFFPGLHANHHGVVQPQTTTEFYPAEDKLEKKINKILNDDSPEYPLEKKIEKILNDVNPEYPVEEKIKKIFKAVNPNYPIEGKIDKILNGVDAEYPLAQVIQKHLNHASPAQKIQVTTARPVKVQNYPRYYPFGYPFHYFG